MKKITTLEKNLVAIKKLNSKATVARFLEIFSKTEIPSLDVQFFLEGNRNGKFAFSEASIRDIEIKLGINVPLSEFQIQKKLVSFAKEQGLLVIHAPNQVIKNPNFLKGKDYHYLAMGVFIGCPDLILINKEGKVMFLELKTEKGRLSTNQEKAIQKLKNYEQLAVVAYGLNEGQEFIKGFI